MDEPAAVSGGNLLLAAANFGGRTVLFARPGSPGFRFALQVIDAETCNGIDVADFFYPQYSGEILLGIEVNGSELLGAVLRPDGSVGVYNFGSRPYLFKTFADATLLFSLPNLVGDLALGSSF